MKKIMTAVLLTALLMLASFVVVTIAAKPPAATTIDPKTIPKFVDQLVIPPAYTPVAAIDPNTGLLTHYYTVSVGQFTQQVLPTVNAKGNPTGFGSTPVWSYEGLVNGVPFHNSPAATFEATRGVPVQVKWVNNLVDANNVPLSHMFPVDPTLHWANPNGMDMPMPPFTLYPPGYADAQTPVPIVTHLHGGEVASGSDGGPEQWWTANGVQGMDYRSTEATDPNAAVYYYPNEQRPTTLWYHDHALGITRINVMSGLAGFYLLRDPEDPLAPSLPSGAYEVPIAIQDRTFNLDGSFWFPNVGINPTDLHPYWMPEFFGDSIMVNGKMWPNLNVEPTTYRLRLLDGSNARFYSLFFVDRVTKAVLPFTQIGTDGGYLGAPTPLTALTIAPGERADILVDFSALPIGTRIIMKNNAKAPFPAGVAPDGSTTGQIMQFTVVSPTQNTPAPTVLPTPWPITIPTLTPSVGVAPKLLTLTEVMGALGPAEVLLDGQSWHAPTTEMTQVGTTVDWIIVNPTADTHPIHLHLVQFQLISRQAFDVNGYMAEWMMNNGITTMTTADLPLSNPTVNVANLAVYLKGPVKPPNPNEMGWKDTVQMNPGEVTIIRVRYTPQDADALIDWQGINLYSFNPAAATDPGYVWHCHIIDHEDNEMMRRQIVTP